MALTREQAQAALQAWNVTKAAPVLAKPSDAAPAGEMEKVDAAPEAGDEAAPEPPSDAAGDGNAEPPVGCAMLYMPEAFLEPFQSLQLAIDRDDVIEYEDEPHVTVRYGVRANEDDFYAAMEGATAFPIVAGELNAFIGEDKDVLFITVDPSDELVALRDMVETQLECDEDTHGDYIPHITVAYLKPGTAEKYLEIENPLNGQSFDGASLEYSVKCKDGDADGGNDAEAKQADGGEATAADAGDAEQPAEGDAVAIEGKGLGDPSEFTATFKIAKSEEASDHTFVYGPVLVPEVEDHQGDIISAEEIEKTAHDYLAECSTPGLMHATTLRSRQAQVVESHILRQPMKVEKSEFPSGTWMLAMKVYDDKLRKMIRGGKLNGFSIGGQAGSAVMEDRR